MANQLPEQDAREALRNHLIVKARETREKYGEEIGYEQIVQMLADVTVVRFPTVLSFDDTPLRAGEFGWAKPRTQNTQDGFVLHIHPHFEGRSLDLPLLVAYHLVTINYGELAGAEEAELFGASLLGLEVEDYYDRLCQLADELSAL